LMVNGVVGKGPVSCSTTGPWCSSVWLR